MRRIFICLLLAVPAAAMAQSGRIKIDLPPSLAANASESVDVSLDGAMLRLAARFLSDDDSGERNVRDMVRKLDGIYVHSYEFDEPDAYDSRIVEKIRAQLGPEWKRIVTVQSRTRENVEIYTQPRGDTIAGLLILSAEPKELTIVNIVGPIDLDKLAGLGGQFGIPRIGKVEVKHE
jgi:hypothetical protein